MSVFLLYFFKNYLFNLKLFDFWDVILFIWVVFDWDVGFWWFGCYICGYRMGYYVYRNS